MSRNIPRLTSEAAEIALRWQSRTRPRILLCPWSVAMVKPYKPQPDNVVLFRVPKQMTKFDIKNYFQCLYNVNVSLVNTRIEQGKRHKVVVGTPHGKPGNHKGLTRVWKQDPDYKLAYLTLADGEKFTFPDVYGNIREETVKAYYSNS